MLFRTLIRRMFSRSLLRKGRKSWLDELEDLSDLYQLSPKFNEDYWESMYTDVIESMVEFAGNAGQVTLLTDYFPEPAKKYCEGAEEDYDPEAFISYVQSDLGDTYYYAINEIIEECSIILQEVWDEAKHTFAEGLFSQSFGTDFNTVNRIYRSNKQALFNYQASSIRRGYKPTDSAAGRAFNSEKNRQNLIRRTGAGPTKPWKSSSSMDRAPGYAAYQQAAARNGKIINP